MHCVSSKRFWMGAAVSTLVVLIILTLFVLIWREKGSDVGYPIDIAHLLRMTSLQAGLTTILSLTLGIALAWALNRTRFWGRSFLISLLSAALVTPGIVVAVGLISVWGRAGWINSFLGQFGWHTGSIFGLHGILYAHVILDATLAAAIILTALNAIPKTRLQLGQNLRLSAGQRFLILDWPLIKPALPGLAAVIFLLAFTSFPIVLLLGGGPANQTFELAIYTAIRIDFDLQSAVLLALIQLALCAILIVPASLFAISWASGTPSTPYHWPNAKWLTWVQAAIILLSTLFLGGPLLSIIFDGRSIGALLPQAAFWQATSSSLIIGIASALLTLALGLIMAMARVAARTGLNRAFVAAPAYIYLTIPGVTLSLGFFIAARRFGLPTNQAAPFVLIMTNALLALPYALATLVPVFEASNATYGRLSQSLNLSNWTRFLWVEWPVMGREIGLVLAMSFCFSLGDLSVIALFGTEDFSTLPWLMSRALGAYRTNDAAAIAAFLLFLSIAIFLITPPLIDRIARART